MLKPAEERLQAIELRLTREQLSVVDRAAVNSGRSRSSIIRETVDGWKAAGAPMSKSAAGRQRLVTGDGIVKVTVYLLPRQVAFLDATAQKLGTTRSEVLRAAVSYWMGEGKTEPKA